MAPSGVGDGHTRSYPPTIVTKGGLIPIFFYINIPGAPLRYPPPCAGSRRSAGGRAQLYYLISHHRQLLNPFLGLRVKGLHALKLGDLRRAVDRGGGEDDHESVDADHVPVDVRGKVM